MAETHSRVCFLVGLSIIIIASTGYILAGDNILVNPHDQLDGEVLTYLLHVRHFGSTFYPELLGGVPETSMQMAAPGLLVFYAVFPPYIAFSVSYALIMIAAYCGMWLLSRSFSVRPWISLLVAVMFAFLPFYGVYGLSIMGIPFIIWCISEVLRKPSIKTRAISCIVIVIYGLLSSPVLSGYFVIIGMLLVVGIATLTKRVAAGSIIWLLILTGVLTGIYIVCNLSLITEVMGLQGKISHKSEVVPSPVQFSILSFFSFLLGGQEHAVSNQIFLTIMLAMSFTISSWYLLSYRKKKMANSQIVFLAYCIQITTLVIVLIAAFYFLFNSAFVINFKSNLPGSLGAFQLDRIYWLYPTVWYFSFAIGAELLVRVMDRRVIRRIATAIIATFATVTLVLSLNQNALAWTWRSYFINTDKPNATDLISWKAFFSEDLFAQIKQQLGSEDADAFFVSVGLFPSIALYNGLYCLDGYSNNYPLEYKHAFRDVIADELDSSENLRHYYDDWGNRCYVFSHEIGQSNFYQKESVKTISDLRINVDALEKLGGKYLLSTVPIENAGNVGLDFVKCFTDSNAPYDIYLYKTDGPLSAS